MQANFLQSFKRPHLDKINSDTLAAFGIRQKISSSGKTSKIRLLGLSRELSYWNKARYAYSNDAAKALSIDDVILLKEIIQAEMTNTSVKHPEVVSDQILFLILGAIQIQGRNHSENAWNIVNKSIKNFLAPPKKNKNAFLLSSLVAITLAVFFYTSIVTKTRTIDDADQILVETPFESPSYVSSTRAVDPLTISALMHVYTKMKDGTCQFPQAAMLPANQREAFLSFVNEGIIDMNNVKNLKLALGYVTCLYPQELMHSSILEL